MIAALKYLVEMLLCSGIFVLLYKSLVEGRVSHRGSRMYLIISTLASVIVPLLKIPIWPAQMFYVDLDLTVNMPEEIDVADLETVHRVVAGTETVNDNTWIIPVLYAIVAGISLLIAFIGIIRIWILRDGATLTKKRGYTLAESTKVKSPFSFIKTIFIGSNTPEDEKDIIITHERSHIKHGHSYERLFMKFMTSVFWINPFIHINARYLEEVQEWQADSDVLGEGYNLGLYRSIIFKQLFGYCPEVSCGLKNSITKKRFLMMDIKLKKYGSLRLAAALILLSGTGLLFGATARPFVEPELSASQVVADTAKTLVIEITKQGETIKFDGGFSLDDDWKLDPDQTVIIKADPDVKMGYITDIKQKLRKAGITKVTYQIRQTKNHVIDLANGGQSGDIDGMTFEPGSTVQIKADGNVSNDEIDEVKRKLREAGSGDMDFPEVPLKQMDNGTYTYQIDRGNTVAVRINAEGSLLAEDGKAPAGIMILRGEDLSPSMDAFAWSLRRNHKVVFFLMNDRATEFERLNETVNNIDKAYALVRNEYSQKTFGKTLGDLSETEYQQVLTEIPRNIMTAKEKNMTGK